MERKRLLLTRLILLAFMGILSISTVFGQTTLKHSYKFEDGTANDGAGTANGLLVGDAAVSNGKLTLSGNGFVGLPGKSMNIAQYESITIEAVFSQASTTGGFSMLYSFGRTNLEPGWPMGVDYLFFQPTRRDDNDCRAAICCLNYNDPWGTETLINSPKIADTDKHYVVTVLTATDMTLYIDGAFRGTVPLQGNNILANVSNDTAYIGASIYTNDNKWKGSVYELNIYSGAMEASTVADRTEGFLGIPVAEASLSSITSNKGDLSPEFNPQTLQYDLNLEYGTSQIKLSGQPKVKGATVKMFDGLENEITDGIVNVTGDGVDIKFDVVALNGFTTKSYFVSTFYYPEEDAASLSAINLSKGALTQAFDADSTFYTAIVPYGTTSVTLTGVPLSLTEKIEGDGTITLTNGQGSASIIVTSANNKYSKIYTVNIYASKIATKKYFYLVHEKTGLVVTESLEGYNIIKLTHPEYENSTQIFEFVGSGVTGQYFIKNLVPSYLTHSATSTWDMLMSPDLSSTLDSNRFILQEFEPGRFRIESVIKNGADGRFMGTNDGNVDTWVFNDKYIDNTLAIWNILPADEVVGPYDTYLSDLAISEVSLSPDFDTYTTDYYLTLPIGTTSLNISATANDANSTVSGTGATTISGNNGVITITVTASDPQYKREYKIHYQMDTPLTLTHSYSFADGTAQDQVGDADGIVFGGTITSGVYTTGSQGEHIKLPAAKIALNSYPSITIEAYVKTGENTGWTMFAYFGGLTGSNAYWLSLARGDDFARANFNTGYESYAQGTEPAADENHHYVSVLTNDTISLYIDGVLAGKTAVTGSSVINKISLENAFLCKSGWNDPTWIGSIYEFNIYSGQMDEQTIAERATNFPVEDTQTDATLSDLQVNGNTIKDFDSGVLNYSMTLSDTALVVPTITATPKNVGASAVVTPASGIPGTTTIVVTAQDGTTKNTYSVVFKHPASSDATLASITVDGTPVTGFNANTKTYTINLTEIQSEIPTVTAVSNDNNATVDISPAASLPGTTKITVTAENKLTKATYYVSFIYTVDVAQTESARIEVLPTIFSDNFRVKTNGKNASVYVYDITGKVSAIRNNINNEVTISVPNTGFYLVKVTCGNTIKTFKVVKTQ